MKSSSFNGLGLPMPWALSNENISVKAATASPTSPKLMKPFEALSQRALTALNRLTQFLNVS